MYCAWFTAAAVCWDRGEQAMGKEWWAEFDTKLEDINELNVVEIGLQVAMVVDRYLSTQQEAWTTAVPSLEQQPQAVSRGKEQLACKKAHPDASTSTLGRLPLTQHCTTVPRRTCLRPSAIPRKIFRTASQAEASSVPSLWPTSRLVQPCSRRTKPAAAGPSSSSLFSGSRIPQPASVVPHVHQQPVTDHKTTLHCPSASRIPGPASTLEHDTAGVVAIKRRKQTTSLSNHHARSPLSPGIESQSPSPSRNSRLSSGRLWGIGSSIYNFTVLSLRANDIAPSPSPRVLTETEDDSETGLEDDPLSEWMYHWISPSKDCSSKEDTDAAKGGDLKPEFGTGDDNDSVIPGDEIWFDACETLDEEGDFR